MLPVVFFAAVLAGLSTAATAADLAPPSCDTGQPAADAPEELRQFDFLIGDYSIHPARWIDGAWVDAPPDWGPARWNGHYGLRGTVIVDEWFDKDPGLDPATKRGINVRQWDPEAGEWDMMWFDDKNRQVQDLRARVIDGRLTMWQVYPERPGFRAYFNRYPDASWERIAMVPDGKGGWVNQTRLKATPLRC